MKLGYFAILTVLFMCLSSNTYAQINDKPAGEIVSDPICFMLINRANHKINGTFRTDLYTREDGKQARHSSNFRFDATGSKDEQGYPSDRAEFCSYGPFYEGRKLELTIKTLFPVFSCKTNVESGPITLSSEPIEDNPMGGYRYFATCFE